MRRTLTLGPLPIMFANQNTELGIPLHTHYAEVYLSYEFSGTQGFPVLATTIDEIRDRLGNQVDRPFMNTRNEGVLEIIFEAFRDWQCSSIKNPAPSWKLCAVDLKVFGVRDPIGHADGTATYRIEV